MIYSKSELSLYLNEDNIVIGTKLKLKTNIEINLRLCPRDTTMW